LNKMMKKEENEMHEEYSALENFEKNINFDED
jgi:hypothetical protein